MITFNKRNNYDYFSKMDDLFSEEFVSQIGIYPSQMHDLQFNRGMKVKRRFAQRIFLEFLQMVVRECVEGNKKFISANKNYFCIYIRQMPEAMKKRILSNDQIYTNVDLLSSGFNMYNFVLYSPFLPKGSRMRSLRISYGEYKDLVRRVNEGQRYDPKIIFKMEDIMPKMKEAFPEMGESVMSRIIRQGCRGMFHHLCMNKNLLLENKRRKISYKVYNQKRKTKKKDAE